MSVQPAYFNEIHEVELEELNDFLREVLGLEGGLQNADELQSPDIASKFTIESLDQVNWAMRKLAALEADRKQTESLYKLEFERLEKWKERKLRGANQSVEFFTRLLTAYMERRREENPKLKTESTPYGKITWTKQQPEWKYENEVETADFLLTLPGKAELAKVEKKIANKTDLKKVVEIRRNVFVKDGEIVDVATVDVEQRIAKGMEYVSTGSVVMELQTGELVDDVTFHETVVVIESVKVVPGIEVMDRPDKLAIKPEV